MIKRAKKLNYDDPPTDLAGYDPTRDAKGFYWDPAAAKRVVGFFAECLCLTTSGFPKFHLQKWQADFVATLYGWKRKSDDTRRYREALFAVPRKNGKSETCAGLSLYGLTADGETRAQVYSAAKTRDQAALIFDVASIMCRQSEALRSMVRPVESRKRLEFAAKHSYYQAMSADAATAHGKNPHLVLFDELHTQPNRLLYDGLKSGMGARQQPLFISLTTAGHDRNSICHEVWTHARNVRDGIVDDPTFLPMIYEIKPGEDWKDEEVWARCNPNLGVTVSLQFLREEYKRAASLASYENTFRNLYLNEWTEQAIRWISMEHWDKCQDHFDWSELRDLPCWGGLDLSSSVDVSALVLAFPVDGKVAIVPHFWICEEQAKRNERSDRVPYREWAKAGLVTITEGNVVDYERIRRDIQELAETYPIQEIAYDRFNSSHLVTLLNGDGINMVQFGQGFTSMSGPSKEFEKLVLGNQLIHDGNKIMRWMASNVATTQDAAGNIKPVKDKSTGRIDGIVAAIMAIGRATTSQQPYSYYETNGLEMA